MTRLAAGEALELARSVRAVCDRMASPERVREIAFAGNGFDSELWLTLCGQVVVAAMALPEELGGAACDASALGVVANELGRALAPVPFVASAVLATGLLLDCKSHALLDSREDLAHILPRVDTRVAGLGRVVRRREEQRMPLEALEMARAVVDQVVGVDDTLVSTEDDLRRRDEREVPLEPTMLCRK